MTLELDQAAIRYAESLWEQREAASADHEAVHNELTELNKLVSATPELFAFFENPAFSMEEKEKVLLSLVEKLGCSKEISNFCRILLSKERLSSLEAIGAAYKKLTIQSEGNEIVSVETAFSMTADQEKKLSQLLERSLGKKVYLSVQVNEALIAGLKVKVRGFSVDSSLENQMLNVKKALLSNEVQ